MDMDTLTLLNDGIRFVRRHAGLIEKHPLLLYSAALPFTPSGTLFYQNFHEPASLPVSCGLVERNLWSPLLQTITVPKLNQVNSIAYSPDGTRMAFAAGNHVRVYSASLGIEVLPPLEVHRLFLVKSVSFSPDGTQIACGTEENNVRLWDASSGIEAVPPMRGHSKCVSSVAFSPSGKFIISGSFDKTIRVWDSGSGKQVGPPFVGHTEWINSVACSPDGSRVVSASNDKTIRVWDIETGLETLPPLEGHTDKVRSIAVSPDGDYIASGSLDGTVGLWHAHTGFQVHELNIHSNRRVGAVTFSLDGSRVVSQSFDKRGDHGTCLILDVTSIPEVIPPRIHGVNFSTVALSPDGTRIASASFGHVQVWDATLRTGLIPDVNAGHKGAVKSLAFSPDGTRFASACEDCTVRLWDATSVEQTVPPMLHKSIVKSVAFSGDGLYIISSDRDFIEDYVWDAVSGERIHGERPKVAEPSNGDIDLKLVDGEYWITDRITKKYLSKLPSLINITYAIHSRSLVVGDRSGVVFVLNVPDYRAGSDRITHTNKFSPNPATIKIRSNKILVGKAHATNFMSHLQASLARPGHEHVSSNPANIEIRSNKLYLGKAAPTNLTSYPQTNPALLGHEHGRHRHNQE